MSLHICPVEPNDWSYDPDDDGDCPECEGNEKGGA